MQDFKHAIEELNLDFSSEQAHRNIFTHLNQNILTSSYPLHNCVPPPYVVIYSIRRMLRPTFFPTQTPNLLDLLTHVENVRQLAVEKAREALIWNDYYMKAAQEGKNEVALLNAKEVATVTKVANAKRDAANRLMYCQIVYRCCELHIYHLWSSEDRRKHRLEHFILCVDDYFPSDQKYQSRRLFQTDLSEEERQELREVEATCVKFMKDALEWEEKRDMRLVAQGISLDDVEGENESVSYSREFSAAFPNLVDEANLVEDIEWYVKTVENRVKALEDVFGVGDAGNSQDK